LKRDFRVYLDDILEGIKRIEKYSRHPDYASFNKDDQAVDAVIRNFEIIGEAAKKTREEKGEGIVPHPRFFVGLRPPPE
jgi:uncharacterized protein with HEPN domain